MFDADVFMTQQVDAPMATTLQGVPDGEYVAMVGDFDSSAFKTIPVKGEDRYVLEIPFLIQDDALKAKLGREQITHRETYWLDFDANGALATGPDKNVRLGQLRAAVGQNVAGQPWAPAMLRGMGPVRIAIKSTTKVNPQTQESRTYTNITKYAKIS